MKTDPTNVFIYGFQGVFNANVFNVQAVHIEKNCELNIEHKPETALTLVELARDFLLPSSVNVRSLAIKLFKLFTLTRQPIRTTTRFSDSGVTGEHYRPVPSDVSLPRLSERRM